MSTIKTDTLSNVAGTKTVPTSTVVDGSAKAWVNFAGTGTVAIRAAFNVSSITDNGLGDYTVNLTSAMPDTSYATTLGFQTDSTSVTNNARVLAIDTGTSPTTSALRICAIGQGASGSRVDFAVINVAIFR